MSKLDSLSGRALEIAGNVGDSIKNSVPDRAMKWIETGAALGAIKTGGKVAAKFARRNPAVAVASAAGAGLVWYLVRRHQKKLNSGAIEGRATRIEARKPTSASKRSTAPRRKPAATE